MRSSSCQATDYWVCGDADWIEVALPSVAYLETPAAGVGGFFGFKSYEEMDFHRQTFCGLLGHIR